ncbi:hypothetical protein SK128_000756 [Halocaridina rubra]|uniref:Uncharacterized protein n=1 Tax=Halocaridina rubra TaxID=373956 RepID=A0AAN8WZQ6_HALRR
MHQHTIPLLEQISQRSRVLFLPPSRNKQHPYILMKLATFTDAFDWNDMSFLYELNRYRSKTKGVALIRQYESTHEDQRNGDEMKESFDYLTSRNSNSGLWFWDSGLPLQLAEREDCNFISTHLKKFHPVDESRELWCSDPVHSGRITNRDMVTMLFNLICNSVLRVDRKYCCH